MYILSILYSNLISHSIFLQGNSISVLISGLIIGLLLFIIVLSLLNTQLRAQKIAKKLTLDFKESEERFRTLLDSAAEAIYEIDTGGCCTFSNKACIQLLGYTNPEQLLGKNMHDLIHHSNSDGSRMDVNECKILKSFRRQIGTHVDNEVFWRADGTCFQTEYWSYPINIQGNIIGAVVSFFDITERRNTEIKLKYWADVFYHAKWGIAVNSSEMNSIEIINPQFAKMHGYSIDEITGRPVQEIFAPDYRIEVPLQIQLSYELGHHSWESIHLRKDGSKFPVLSDITTIKDSQGKVIYRIVNVQDITERKLAEEMIKVNEARYRLLFDNMTNGFSVNKVITDENNNPVDFKIIEMNYFYKEFGGFDKNEIEGKTMIELYPGIELNLLRKLCQVGLTGVPLKMEYFSKSLNKYFILNCYSPEKGIFALIFDDITEHKQAEIKIQQQNLELTKLNSDKDLFISMLAHDLRSPFISILGFLELLTKNIRKYDVDKSEKLINILNGSANNVYRLLEDILIWIKSQSGKLPFEPQKLNFSEICADVIEVLKQNIDSKNISINHFSSGVIDMYVDKNMFESILRNLVSNAIKYTRNGGRIDIYAQIEGENIIITVSDSGTGIDLDKLPDIFDISRTESISGTENEKGTGLGLLICKEFVDRHGGKIWVKSELGKGSNFNISIPKLVPSPIIENIID